MKIKRIGAWVLSLLLLLELFPGMALAVEGEKSFYLAAQTADKIVILPERIRFSGECTVAQALAQSGHDFSGIESGMIDAIDGVAGNYTRSDELGNADLQAQVRSGQIVYFSEGEDYQPSVQRVELIKAIADCRQEASDVQAAAKQAYDAAVAAYLNASDVQAKNLSDALREAVRSYKEAQSGAAYELHFSDGEGAYTQERYPGIRIQATNPYGKEFTDEDGDGVLSLVPGSYTFEINCGGRGIRGDVEFSGTQTISTALPSEEWMLTDRFQLSESYDDGFLENRVTTLAYLGDGRFSAAVPDSFSGALYTWIEFDSQLSWQTPPTLTAIYSSALTGLEIQKELVFSSQSSSVPQALALGGEGNVLTYRMATTNADGYEIYRDYTLTLQRIPTLQSLVVAAVDAKGNTTPQASVESFSPEQLHYTYKVLDTVKTLKITAVTQGSYAQGYTVTINGQSVPEGESAMVDLQVDDSGNLQEIPVEVRCGDYTTTYLLQVKPGAGKQITFNTTANDVTLMVVNKNGDELGYTRYKQANGYNAYQYTLVPGETYTYVATRNDYYHSSKEFTMEADAGSVITVDVPVEDWLEELHFGDSRAPDRRDSYLLQETFSGENHAYTLLVPDTQAAVYLWAKTLEKKSTDGEEETSQKGSDGEEKVLEAQYRMIHSTGLYHGVEQTVTVTSGAKEGARLQRILLSHNGSNNTMILRISQWDEANQLSNYQDYEILLQRSLSLKDLSVYVNGNEMGLTGASGSSGYSSKETKYTVMVPAAATQLQLNTAVYEKEADNYIYGQEDLGYQVRVEGELSQGSTTLALSGDSRTETVHITVSNRFNSASTEYTLTVIKAAAITAHFVLSAEDALSAVYEKSSGRRIWPEEDGGFSLSVGYVYEYAFTCPGYVGQSGIMQFETTADGTVLQLKEQSIPVGSDGSVSVEIQLKEAEKNTRIKPEIPSDWADFRGTSYTYENGVIQTGGSAGSNNTVISQQLPKAAEDGVLYWAKQLGNGFSSDAVGCPILVGDYLITYSSTTIYKVDPISGEVVSSGQLARKSSFSIQPPTYYQGMIFLGLSEGTVQAFNADTLESLWVYRDPLGGQPNCPLTVYDGYLYTGFWNREDGDANLVCLSVSDEDPHSATESKTAVWRHTQRGGFYWAGAYVCDDFLLVGTDDGNAGYTAQTSSLLLMDPRSGKILDRKDGLNGDIRSSVCYDAESEAYYFTSKGGSFYRARVEQQEGKWKISELHALSLNNGTEDSVAMSTSTPTVYKGRAYVGVSGSGQFTAYSGHNITVIDLTKEEMKIAYSVETAGYPQTSGILTNFYEESGCVYLYFFENIIPGTLRVLQDRPGQIEPSYVTMETVGGALRELAYALFTPQGNQAEHAICSPIVDRYGTIYFKNDSAQLMAFGSTIRELRVEQQPKKTAYQEGEVFDPDGIKVTAVYANGATRDVTKYITYSTEKLSRSDKEVTLVFPYVMYHNRDQADGSSEAGINVSKPTVTVKISVSERTVLLGDVNGDGVVDGMDAVAILRYVAGLEQSVFIQAAADVNGDGSIDGMDAVAILRMVAGLSDES